MTLNVNDPYLRYYTHQAGSGVGNVYRGASFQRGHGIGSFLGGLFRTVSPILKSIGHEALKSGVGLLSDVVYSTPTREAFRNRAKEFTTTLKRKADTGVDRLMSGSGYKRMRRVVTPQSIDEHLTGRKRKPALRKVQTRKKLKCRTVTKRSDTSRNTKRVTRKRSTKRQLSKKPKAHDIFY